MKKLSIIFLSTLTVLFFSACNNNYIPDIKTEQKKQNVPVTSISLEPDETPISLVNGTHRQITAHVIPKNATNKKLAYTSNDLNIASIDDKGLITANAVGNTNITIKAADGISRTVKLTVTAVPIPVTSIVIEGTTPASLFIGESYRIIAKVLPDEATDRELIYSTDNNNARVADDGTVTAQSEGSVNITVKSRSNPDITKTVPITIKQRPSIKLIKEEITSGSDETNPTFKVKTLNGKLDYTVEVVSDWLEFDKKDSDASEDEDTIYIKAKTNKTVWDRTAYIKFKGVDNKYIKDSNGNKLEVKFTQKENKNPIVTIKWVDGIGEPNSSEKKKIPVCNGEKKVYWNDDKIFWWYETDKTDETDETKWFNNRKAKPVGAVATDGGDGNQCWAKTASNMLHWWFVQNKENINNYITKKNITGAKKDEYQDFYKRGIPDNQEPTKSYIAKTFRVKAHNGEKGDYIIGGLSWYLYGNKEAKISRQGKDKKPLFDDPALFKDVFNKDNTPIERINVHGKDSFNEIISSALDSKKAIGIDIWGTKGRNEYGHAITLWGAAFDEEENIIAIYVVDNNFAPNRIFPYGIWYKDGKPYLFNYGVNKFVQDRYVGQVTTLDKGETQWQDWLSKH